MADYVGPFQMVQIVVTYLNEIRIPQCHPRLESDQHTRHDIVMGCVKG